MNFNQAPITRIINTRPLDTATYASPAIPGAAGGIGTVLSLLSGRAVTIFFETPNWPLAASKISLKLLNIGAPTGLYACPNVYMTDADSKLFIRGNSIYANNGTVANGIHVVYSAVLRNLVNTGVRSVESLVRPGDVIKLTPPTASPSSNLVNDAKVTAVRLQGQNTVIEFSVDITPNSITGSGLTGWNKLDLLFHAGSVGTPTDLVGLSRDQISLKASSNAAGWSGDLGQAVNLSYPSANKVGIVPEPNASLYTLASKDWVIKCGAPFASTTVDYTFSTDIDQNSGSVGYKCISIVDSSTSAGLGTDIGYQVEVTIYPAY